jgi:hypothetical protein
VLQKAVLLLVRVGDATRTHLAKLGGVTRPRVAQIMNLPLFTLDIQELLLDLSSEGHGEEVVNLNKMLVVADRREQRK